MLLKKLNLPQDLRKLSLKELQQVCDETRQYIIDTLSQSGGHFASNLGTVELTVGIHTVYDTPRDKIIWDVGHQCYPHKILTGRMDRLATIRKKGGLAPFLKRSESPYDEFGAGHASTAISAALGMAQARDLKKENFAVAAVVGDGALSGGLAFEGINNARDVKGNFTIILNDNDMSISKPVGAISKAITNLRLNQNYKAFRETMMDKFLRHIPWVGKGTARKLETMVEMFRDVWFTQTERQAVIFEELGFRYFGPIDGHDLPMVLNALKYAKQAKGPVILHFLTKKGKGYEHAEADPIKYHGVSKFDVPSGQFEKSQKPTAPSYSKVFGDTLIQLAENNPSIVALTPAMLEGSGMVEFQKKFPERTFDVGIAEEHCVTASAGFAAQGLTPFCVIYSTFLQRGFDQIIHDVALQKLPVVFCLDRGGIAGADGPTHHGVLDYSYLRLIPHMVHMAPKDENEFQHMLYTASQYKAGPIAVRYPRGAGAGIPLDSNFQKIEIGKSEIVYSTKGTAHFDLGLIAIGNQVYPTVEVAKQLEQAGHAVQVVNARFVKPLDEKMIATLARQCEKLVTVEENNLPGGFGSAVLELLADQEMNTPVIRLGLPDQFIEHGSQTELQTQYGLDIPQMAQTLAQKIKQKALA